MINNIIEKRKAFLLLLLILIFFGWQSYKTIPREEYPDIRIPIIFVSIELEGISPEDGEKLLLNPLEKELNTIIGIKKQTSYAIEGMVSVILEFNAGFDNEKALSDVREKIDLAKSELPKNIEEPRVKELSFSEFPVLNIILTGSLPERSLVKIAKDLQDKLEAIDSVLNVNIAGDLEETVEIIIDPIKLEAYNISFSNIQNFADNNKLITAGSLNSATSQYAIKIPSLLESIDDILNLPIVNNDARVIKVSDIATVSKSFKPRESVARVNGYGAITLEVSKRSGKNVIDAISEIKKLIDAEKPSLPKNLNIIYSGDSSKRIIESNIDLQNNIILAIFLVLIILLFTVGLTPAFLVALSIPSSFVISILVLKYFGVTLSVVVLFALILSVGLLVDSAIVITEYADRKLNEGISAKKAFSLSVQRMFWPIFLSTLTTIIVFMPLLFWPGTVGQFMKYIPITLIVTLSASLLVATIFVPVIGSWSKKENNETKYIFGKSFVTQYTILVAKVIKKPLNFVIIIILFSIAIGFLTIKYGNGIEFFPDLEPDNAIIDIRARGNLSIYEKDKITKEIEAKIIDMNDQIRIFYSRSGNPGSNNSNSKANDIIASIQLELQDWKERKKAKEIINDLKKRLENIYGVIIEVDKEKKGPASGKDIQIEFNSSFTDIISSQANNLVNFLNLQKEFTDIEDSRSSPAIEWRFNVQKELAKKSGVNIEDIGSFIKLVTNGVVATSYRPENSDEEIDIVIRFPSEYRNVSQLNSLKVILDNKDAIPISNFVERTAGKEVKQIDRTDGKRVINIKANMADNFLPSQGVQIIKKWLDKNLDKKINFKFRGEDEDSNETSIFLKRAFGLAILIMALLLVLKFNSIYKTIIILSAVFLSTVGVLISLYITNSAFGIVMCGMGVISLAGIVVNNNIIFIDSYDKMREEGMGAEEAIIETAKLRLRPILLTSITTILGLIPMVFRMNINFFTRDIYWNSPASGWWNQLATTITGGLSFATILTLFLTPALLMLGEKLRRS